MRSDHYTMGRREGIKYCVEWLHKRAKEMNDPHAVAILNCAAFNLGWAAKARFAEVSDNR